MTPVTYKWTSTKEYHDAFPCAYRQYKADSHCRFLHGYAFSMKFYFGTNDLDARRWAADYGGLKELKQILESQFDHTTLVAESDPHLDWYKEAEQRGIMKLTILPNLGCESLADMLYKYINTVYIPDMWGRERQQDCGAIAWKCARHRLTWLSAKVTASGTRN